MATDWPSVALGTVVILGSYTAAAVTYLATTLMYLLGLAMRPIAALYQAALIVCAPALFLAQFVLAPFIAVLSLVPKLEVCVSALSICVVSCLMLRWLTLFLGAVYFCKSNTTL